MGYVRMILLILKDATQQSPSNVLVEWTWPFRVPGNGVSLGNGNSCIKRGHLNRKGEEGRRNINECWTVKASFGGRIYIELEET